MSLIAVDYEAIVLDDASVKSLDSDKYSPAAGDYAGKSALEAWVLVQEGAILWTLHGADPNEAADVGMLSRQDFMVKLAGLNAISGFKAVKVGGTAKVKVTYFFAPLPQAPIVPDKLW